MKLIILLLLNLVNDFFLLINFNNIILFFKIKNTNNIIYNINNYLYFYIIINKLLKNTSALSTY